MCTTLNCVAKRTGERHTQRGEKSLNKNWPPYRLFLQRCGWWCIGWTHS